MIPSRAACVALTLILAGACASNEADTTDTAGAGGPDTSAIQGAGTVPNPPPAAVDSLRDTATRRKNP